MERGGGDESVWDADGNHDPSHMAFALLMPAFLRLP